MVALWFSRRPGKVALANLLKEAPMLLLKPVLGATLFYPGHALLHTEIKNQGLLWLKIAQAPVGELVQFSVYQSAPRALIGIGGIRKSIRDNPLASI